MKHSHIGLVALAAMAIAGCGGGSDNGSGAGGEFTVTAGTGVTQSRLAQLGEVYTVPSSGRRIPVDGGHIVFSGCPASATDGCTVMVSSSSSGIVVMSTVEGVRARFQATPPATSNNNNDDEIEDLNEEIEQKDAEIENLKNQVSDAEEQGSLKVRVPKVLVSIGTFDHSSPFSVTVGHTRGSTNIKVPGFKSTTPKSISGWQSFRYTFDEAGADNRETIYLYTNIDRPNTRSFWKVHGPDGLGVTVAVSTSDTDKGSATVNDGMRGGLDGAIRVTGNPIPIDTSGESPRPARTGNYQRIEIPASFGGTPGRLICDRCAGTVGSDSTTGPETYYTSAKGFIGSWSDVTFRANRLADPHNRNQDETYLYFGMWANHPKDENESYATPAFQWIRGGPAITTVPASLEGEAEFTGGAVGEYAIGAVGNRDAKTGSFIASAKLYADFGDESSSGGMIHGQITDFEEDGSSLGWGTLRLVGNDDGLNTPGSKAPIGTLGDAGGLEIEGTQVTGEWNSGLYGVENDSAGVTAAADNALLSAQCQKNGCAAELAGVAGWFHASGGIVSGGGDTDVDAAIVGAFGAAYKE